mgnify:CR=1 FL=1
MASESRLAEIYRQELKNKGLFSAFISASAARNKEKLDIRNMIPKSGISGAALEKIFGKGLVRYAMAERNVLSGMNHPFIVKLNYAFQS